MLDKTIEVDQIEWAQNGNVQVRTVTSVSENGVLVSRSFHRHIVAPGDDYSNEDLKVQAVCAVAHTQEAIEAYRASLQGI